MSKKEDILAAALELFADRGYHGTSVGLITERAGVAAGTVYRHFKDKRDLINVLYRHWKIEVHLASTRGIEDEPTPRQKFMRSWQNLFEFAAKHQKELAFMELHHHAPYLDDESRRLVARYYADSLKWWDHLRETQVVKDMPSPVIKALTSGIFSGLLKAARSGRIDLNEDVTELVELICWEAFRR
ncbi:MAG: TetR/AcrR family transcriptional regulator [Proteobacteria bacterium]|nr:TetR/AcrR family transcriptional regulator [Pseudomonadota bacterium]